MLPKILNTSTTDAGLQNSYPYDMAATTKYTLPAGCPIMTTIFIVDKIAVAFSDGEDHWYCDADTPVDAGQPVSALF